MEDIDLLYRTVVKMRESQKKKKEIVDYIMKNKPYLLGSTFKGGRIKDCCNELVFRDYLNGEKKLYRANFCKYDKFCLACSTRRSIRMIHRFIQWIRQYELYEKHWYHITLTIRHNKNQSLGEVMDKLCIAKEKLGKKYRNWKRATQKKKSFFNNFDGIVSSIEVTYSEKNGWHPHIHILACSESALPIEYLDKWHCNWNKELQEEWHKITGDSFQVSMREITVMEWYFDRSWIWEVFKYAVKFSVLDVPHLVDLIELQHKKKYHFFSTYWIFRWWKLDSDEDEDWDFVEQTLYFFEDEYMAVELPEQKGEKKRTVSEILDEVVSNMDEIGF